MDSFLNYLIEANFGLLMFLACYHFILRAETSYRFIRFFMLAGIFASAIFPLIHAHSNGEASIFAVGGMLPPLSTGGIAVDYPIRARNEYPLTDIIVNHKISKAYLQII